VDRPVDLIDVVRDTVATRRDVAVDERERRSVDRFLAELERLDRPFDEHADAVHVTGSAIVVGGRGVVLHLHKRLGLWLQPGGHVDEGETPWDAARREAREETGLDVAFAVTTAEHAPPPLVHVDVHPGPRGHTHLDLRYLLVAPDADPSPPPDESQQVRWFAWDAAIAVADDGLAGALRALQP
jgi:8-oxo-dGTP pyrophosphatase MutT (NUDIX family)